MDLTWDSQLIPTPNPRAEVDLDAISAVGLYWLREVFEEKEDYLGYVVQFRDVVDVDICVRGLEME